MDVIEIVFKVAVAAFALGGAIGSIKVVRAHVKSVEKQLSVHAAGVDARIEQAVGEFRAGIAQVHSRLDAAGSKVVQFAREHA